MVVELTRVEDRFSRQTAARYLEILKRGGVLEWTGPPAVVIFRRGSAPDLRDGTHRLAALHAYGHGDFEVPVTLKLETIVGRP